MFCGKCGSPIHEESGVCSRCGERVSVSAPKAPKSGSKKIVIALSALVIVLAIGVLSLGAWVLFGGNDTETQPVIRSEISAGSSRLRLLNFNSQPEDMQVQASVTPYRAAPGLTNVVNKDQFYLSEEETQALEENLFCVSGHFGNEFFEAYEYNRYAQIPNFVTVDSMMHTYHLYFSLLLNRTEKNYLSGELLALSQDMMEKSMEQYDALVGTQWEDAAYRNVVFFATAACLQDSATQVPDYAKSCVEAELGMIYAAAGIQTSQMTGEFMDYTQFKPRGYYEGDQILEMYFRAMMWYGQINYAQSEEVLNRCALLMTLAMQGDALRRWEAIYSVTAFFVGTSDDLGYYEYLPAIQEAYGQIPTIDMLKQDAESFVDFVMLIKKMDPPAINSVPVYAAEEGDLGEITKGFRFMGQRFTIDASIMQRLIYRAVEENPADELRMLPDTLDVAAALGSDVALELLEEQGATEYKGYEENMQQLRGIFAIATEDTWTSSLYSSWLYTLDPLLDAKGEGYPSFMTSRQWQKKSVETFAGSYTELKHDTVLYAKQVMAEMGGGPQEVIDDRGYVEPEVEVYRRFMLLAQQTADGLKQFGMIGEEDIGNLGRLAELAGQLMEISRKELREETLTEEEYELIRAYGGTLEHFWIEAVKDRTDAPYHDPWEIPASLVTDIATDPDAGTVLHIANGKPACIYVIVPVDGQLRLASGMVYDFYQFEQPMANRLTDTQWRQMIGEWAMPDGTFNRNGGVPKPWWTTSYRVGS